MILTLKQFGDSVTLQADDTGLLLKSDVEINWLKPETWPVRSVQSSEGLRSAYDIAMLLEMGLAEQENRIVTIPSGSFPEIHEEGITLTIAFTRPSPFILNIDRRSDIGRPNFAYTYRYLLGGTTVPLKRTGYYVTRPSTGDIWHLDDTMFALVDAMDKFNALSPEEKDPQVSWLAFADVKSLSKQTNAVLESTLENNDVIVPSSIGLDLFEDELGELSFIPTCKELDASDFRTVFQRNDVAHGFYSLDRPGMRKLRIVLTDKQQAVLERMKRVRRVFGALKESLISNPEQVFDGVTGDVELPYGDRVIGIGAFEFTPVPKQENADRGMSELWSGENDHDPTDAIPKSEEEKEKAVKLALLIDTHDETVDASYLSELEIAHNPAEMQQYEHPRSLRAESVLKTHQQAGVHWLQNCTRIPGRHGVLLADDMGLGKTLQILSFLAWAIESGRFPDLSRSSPPFRPILIVAPLILLDTETWEKEITKFFLDSGDVFGHVLSLYGPMLRAFRRRDAEGREDVIGKPILDLDKIQKYRVVITNYEAVRDYEFSFAYFLNGKSLWSIVVTDEAHEYKTPNTKISHAMKAIQPEFRIACTGTPVENRLLDLWNIFDTIQPGLLGAAREFVTRYEQPSDPAKLHSASVDLKERLLYRKPEAFVLRRSKSEVLDLPTKHEQKIICDMSSFEVACHQELRIEMRTTTRTEGKLGLLQKFARLYQHPALLRYSDECSVDELLAQSSKLSQLINILEVIQSQKEKAIIFCRHKDMQRILARVLSAKFRRSIRIINGDTARIAPTRKVNVETRNGILKEFKSRDGFDVLILSPFVAGVGLTITEANHVIHYGRWWNPAVEAQATDRAYRIGQSKEVHVYFLINEDASNTIGRTFDRLLDDLMERKKDVASRTFDYEDFLLPREDEQRAGMEVYAQLGEQL